MASYAEIHKQSVEDRKFSIPAGAYKVRYKDCKLGKSRKGYPMFSGEFKVIDAVDKPMLAVIKAKGFPVRDYFTDMPELQWNPFDSIFDFIVAAGGDLSNASAEDENYSGLVDIFEVFEEIPPVFIVELTVPKKGGNFLNTRYCSIEEAVGKGIWVEIGKAVATKPKAVATKPKADTVEPKADTAEKVTGGITYEMLIGNGWSDEDILNSDEYKHLAPVKKTVAPKPPKPPKAPKAPKAPKGEDVDEVTPDENEPDEAPETEVIEEVEVEVIDAGDKPKRPW